jgi:septal ring factor EnvC (AmiA/AmiB activator)
MLIPNEEMRRLGIVSLAAASLFAAGFAASWMVSSVDPNYRLGRVEASVDGQQQTLGVAVTKLDVAISRLEDVGARVGEMAAQIRETEQRLTKLELKIAALDARMRADEGALEARGVINHAAPDHRDVE